MDLKRFQEDRKIDPASLDLAAATQADIFFYWAQQSVKARMEQDKMKANLDLVASRLKLQARSSPDAFGLSKVTEAGLDEVVTSHDDFIKATEESFAAREESLLLDWAVQTLEQRKRMIEVLVTLHGQQYFAGPATPHDLVANWNNYQESRRENLNSMQRQKSRQRTEKGLET